MQAGNELLIDPIGWFSGFLAHFIKDDLAVSTIQIDPSKLQRGVVNLDTVMEALKHEYTSPSEHIPQVMALLCGLEMCVPLKTADTGIDGRLPASASVNDSAQPTTYLFPCLLPRLISQSVAGKSASMANLQSIRGHRFRESSGFIPPGLFAGIMARFYKQFPCGSMHPSRMWNDYVLLEFNHKSTGVLVRLNIDSATIDVIGWAEQSELLFVGAAKGQASVVIWVAHLIRTMLAQSYSQLNFDEYWLCPNSKCHGIDAGSASEYHGSEYLLSQRDTRRSIGKSHDCVGSGCFHFLGLGHSVDQVSLRKECIGSCKSCGTSPVFRLRDKITA